MTSRQRHQERFSFYRKHRACSTVANVLRPGMLRFADDKAAPREKPLRRLIRDLFCESSPVPARHGVMSWG